MTERIKKLNELQEQAVDALEEAGFRGTLMLAPGLGKTFCSIKVLYRMLEKGLIDAGAKVIFLAETVVREKTVFEEEIPKFNSLFNKDVLSDFDIVFHCYQARPEIIYNDFEDVDVVILDEILSIAL